MLKLICYVVIIIVFFEDDGYNTMSVHLLNKTNDYGYGHIDYDFE